MQGGDAADIGRTEQPLTAVAQVDFESYALGALPSPAWFVSGAGATTIGVEATTDHGRAAVLRGSPTSGAFVTAAFAFTSADPVLRAEVDIKPAAGSAFVFAVNGAGSSLGARRIRLQRVPGSDTLTAQTVGVGSLDCGVLRSGVWSRVALVIRQQEHTFDVLIDGAPSACTAAATQIGTPFDSLTLMDASNEGFGGVVAFDNIAVNTDAAPPCTPPATPPATVLDVDFDADPLGALPAPWFTSPASSRSTARVVNATGHGRALQLHGSTRSGDFLTAGRGFTSSQTDIELQFALRPNTGASFVAELDGAGGSIGARRIRLTRSPGSNALVANTAGTANLSCGSVASNAWSSVTLTVHTQSRPHTFDVRIDGQATACTGAVTELSPPFSGISVMDASNANFGGDVLFDEFLVTAFGPPSGSCP